MTIHAEILHAELAEHAAEIQELRARSEGHTLRAQGSVAASETDSTNDAVRHPIPPFRNRPGIR